MNEQTDSEVLHDVDNHRFVLTLDGQEVQTKYRLTDEQTLDFYSTYTPTQLRGRQKRP